MTPAEFVAKVWPFVKNKLADEDRKVQLAVLAHAAYETGWGKARAYVYGNNLFNITRLTTDPRPVIMASDLEYSTKDSAPKKITQRFAAYDTLGDSLEHYWQFIGRTRYEQAIPCLRAGDLPGFISALSKGRYFTLPLADYLSTYLKMVQSVTSLADKQDATAPN